MKYSTKTINLPKGEIGVDFEKGVGGRPCVAKVHPSSPLKGLLGTGDIVISLEDDIVKFSELTLPALQIKLLATKNSQFRRLTMVDFVTCDGSSSLNAGSASNQQASFHPGSGTGNEASVKNTSVSNKELHAAPTAADTHTVIFCGTQKATDAGTKKEDGTFNREEECIQNYDWNGVGYIPVKVFESIEGENKTIIRGVAAPVTRDPPVYEKLNINRLEDYASIERCSYNPSNPLLPSGVSYVLNALFADDNHVTIQEAESGISNDPIVPLAMHGANEALASEKTNINLVGHSRGGVSCFVAAWMIYLHGGKDAKIRILALDPVPGPDKNAWCPFYHTLAPNVVEYRGIYAYYRPEYNPLKNPAVLAEYAMKPVVPFAQVKDEDSMIKIELDDELKIPGEKITGKKTDKGFMRFFFSPNAQRKFGACKFYDVLQGGKDALTEAYRVSVFPGDHGTLGGSCTIDGGIGAKMLYHKVTEQLLTWGVNFKDVPPNLENLDVLKSRMIAFDYSKITHVPYKITVSSSKNNFGKEILLCSSKYGCDPYQIHQIHGMFELETYE